MEVLISGLNKVGAVLTGYLVAFLVASAVVYFRILFTQDADADASSGMYAFGDSMLFMFVFGVVALFPTILALYYLRPFPRFWAALSVLSLAVAVIGILAAAMIAFGSSLPVHDTRWVLVEFLAILLMFAAPLLAAAFVLSALIAPTARSRWALAGAAAIEGAVSAYALLHWFLLPHLF